MKASPLFLKGWSFLLCWYWLFSPIQQARAQLIPPSVSPHWQVGTQTVRLSDDVRKAIEARIATFDIAHLEHNIEPAMLILEWVKTFAQSTQDSIPLEFCYLALLDNQLVATHPTQSGISRQADNAFWGLSAPRIERLHLQNSLHQTDQLDDSHNLRLATQEVFIALKQAYDNYQNWTLALLIFDHGYDEARQVIGRHYSSRAQYKDKRVFDLGLQSHTLIEYFALRHVLEHLIIKQPSPKKYLVSQSIEKSLTLDKAAKLYNTDAAALQIYNPWLKGNRAPRCVASHLFSLVDREKNLRYLYPVLPKMPAQPQPVARAKTNAPTARLHEGAAGNREDDKFFVPAPVNVTNEVPHLHRVKKGETLFYIARVYSLPIADLRRLNPHKKHTDLLRIGDVLLIRARDMREQMDRTARTEKVLTSGAWRGGYAQTFLKKTQNNRQQRRVEAHRSSLMRGDMFVLVRLTPTHTRVGKVYRPK